MGHVAFLLEILVQLWEYSIQYTSLNSQALGFEEAERMEPNILGQHHFADIEN
jgi:hypothetical protein